MCRPMMEKFLINRVDLEAQWDIKSCSLPPAPPRPHTPTLMGTAPLCPLSLKCKDQHSQTRSLPTSVTWKASHPSLTLFLSPKNSRVTYMQFRAARSLCMKFFELKYSIPLAMSIMNLRSVWTGKFWKKLQFKSCSWKLSSVYGKLKDLLLDYWAGSGDIERKEWTSWSPTCMELNMSTSHPITSSGIKIWSSANTFVRPTPN